MSLQTFPPAARIVSVSHLGAQIDVSLIGATVVRWRTASGVQPIYVSPKSAFAKGKAIRGGVPICWPQFSNVGPLATSHGFVRADDRWTVVGGGFQDSAIHRGGPSDEHEPGRLTLALAVPDWGTLTYTVAILSPNSASFTLTFHNTSTEPKTMTAALHSYFATPSIRATRLSGAHLYRTFVDSTQKGQGLSDPQPPLQAIDREVDRIYLGVNGRPIHVHVPAAPSGRQGAYTLTVEASGFPDTVIWNPWIEKTAKMGDLPSDAYESFLCIESGAIRNRVAVGSGGTWEASQRVSVGDAVRAAAPSSHL